MKQPIDRYINMAVSAIKLGVTHREYINKINCEMEADGLPPVFNIMCAVAEQYMDRGESIETVKAAAECEVWLAA